MQTNFFSIIKFLRTFFVIFFLSLDVYKIMRNAKPLCSTLFFSVFFMKYSWSLLLCAPLAHLTLQNYTEALGRARVDFIYIFLYLAFLRTGDIEYSLFHPLVCCLRVFHFLNIIIFLIKHFLCNFYNNNNLINDQNSITIWSWQLWYLTRRSIIVADVYKTLTHRRRCASSQKTFVKI